MEKEVLSERSRNKNGLLLVTEIFDSSILRQNAAWSERLDD